jgi:hypothetical protein
MVRQIKKLAKAYGDSQDQAVKRWGVQTCRDLAKYTQIFGNSATQSKKTLYKEALNVIYAHDGAAKPSKTGRSMTFKNQGRKMSVSSKDYLRSESEVWRWIDQNRTAKHRHTRKLHNKQKKVCSLKVFKSTINLRHKMLSGRAKDGWLDAGEHIGRGQKGSGQVVIAANLMKFARKREALGSSVEGSRMFKSFGILKNHVSYSSKGRSLSNSQKRKALRDGMDNTYKWYKRVIAAENKKKKR